MRDTPVTKVAKYLFTTNKDRMPRNLTVRESEILEIEAQLLVELESQGYVLLDEQTLAAALEKAYSLVVIDAKSVAKRVIAAAREAIE